MDTQTKQTSKNSVLRSLARNLFISLISGVAVVLSLIGVFVFGNMSKISDFPIMYAWICLVAMLGSLFIFLYHNHPKLKKYFE
ncbi:MAG: hypothetical protein ABIH21_02695 [Patescibacteria group bacterium]